MFKQSSMFQYRLEDETIDLRKQAEGMPDGIRRDELLRMASRIDNSVTLCWIHPVCALRHKPPSAERPPQ
jgi:hypothetical protein